MNNIKSRNTAGNKEAQKKSALERSNSKLKRIIAGMSVALVACLVYIFAYPSPSVTQQGTMNRNNPAVAPTAAPAPVAAPSDAPAAAPQSPPSGTPAVTPETGTPSDQRTAKLNPPHGEPGHRCEIPVGSPLP
jgi:hypothetical protein